MKNYGATSEEWEAAIALAKPDLLPYIADPKVEIAPYSRITPGAKTPSRINPHTGLGVGIGEWPTHIAEDRHFLEWRSHPELGICLITRDIRAFDIDIDDEEQADEVEAFIRYFLDTEPMPARFREGAGRRTLLFRIHDAPGPLKGWSVPTPSGAVELLMDRQQTTIAGAHPNGSRYYWRDGWPTNADVPVVALDDVVDLVRALRDEYGHADFHRDWGVVAPPPLPKGVKPDTSDPAVQYIVDNDLLVDFADDGALYVKCPWEHKHNSETKYDAAKYFPSGTGGRSDPGYNCFHSYCQTMTWQNYLDAIGYYEDEFEVVEQPPGKEVQKPRPALTYKGNTPIIEPTLENVVKLLEWGDGPKLYLCYDAFRDVLLYKDGDEPWAELDDDVYTLIRLRMAETGVDPTLGKAIVVDAVSYVARSNVVDSAQEWLSTKEWDGVPRINRFHVECLGLADTAYHRAVSRYWWTAMAGRVIEPGLKCDMVPVLSGKQGQRKSTLCEVICPTPNEFVELNLALKDDDLVRMLRGKLVGEWVELRGLNSRDAESIKGWVSQRSDHWIPKYKEFGTLRLRRFLLVGTTNHKRYLNDPTGSRRFLPLEITTDTINTEWAIEHREQLWAEAAEIFKAQGLQHAEADRLAGRARKIATRQDPWAERVGKWLAVEGEGYTSSAIAHRAIHVQYSSINRQVQNRISGIMTQLGWSEDADGRWRFPFA